MTIFAAKFLKNHASGRNIARSKYFSKIDVDHNAFRQKIFGLIIWKFAKVCKI